MSIYIKAILFGSLFGVLGGIVGYVAAVLYLVIGHGSLDSYQLFELLRSNKAMYWSMPFSFLVLLISGYIASRKLPQGHYWAALFVALFVCLSIRIGPLKIISIHMNYMPIVIGSLIGAYLFRKTNKLNKNGEGETATSA